jgi:molybdate transport system substrate-binding protein
MSTTLHGISSMATRWVLAELAQAYQARSGVSVRIESVGGVDAARRVQAGEALDVVLLACDAIDRLAVSGHVVPGSRVDWVTSPVAMVVREGAPRPAVATQDQLREAVLAARSLGYSTGPSGVALARLFQHWGIAESIAPRIVTPPPGVPVGALVAQGEVELGFQQLSELIHLPGIAVLGPLPDPIQIVTTFSAGLCATSRQPDAVRQWLDFLASSDAELAKRRQGMAPV